MRNYPRQYLQLLLNVVVIERLKRRRHDLAGLDKAHTRLEHLVSLLNFVHCLWLVTGSEHRQKISYWLQTVAVKNLSGWSLATK